MYEKNQQPQRKWYGQKLYILLAVCLILCIVTIVMVSGVFVRHSRYKQYISAFSNSTSYAYSQGYVTVSVDGVKRQLTGESIHSAYSLIVNCRGIMEQKRPKTEPEVIFDFGDGSLMEFWTSKLVDSTNTRQYGLLIGYRNPEGEYYYDTDRLDIDRVKLLVRRKVDTIGKT